MPVVWQPKAQIVAFEYVAVLSQTPVVGLQVNLSYCCCKLPPVPQTALPLVGSAGHPFLTQPNAGTHLPLLQAGVDPMQLVLIAGDLTGFAQVPVVWPSGMLQTYTL
jgi:hypothetical protein